MTPNMVLRNLFRSLSFFGREYLKSVSNYVTCSSTFVTRQRKRRDHERSLSKLSLEKSSFLANLTFDDILTTNTMLSCRTLYFLLLLWQGLILHSSLAFAPFGTHPSFRPASHLYNLLDDLGDMMGMGSTTLAVEDALPYHPPFCTDKSCTDSVRTFAVQERLFSFTGEDFDVYDAFTGQAFVRVRGAMLHLPGKDKMRMIDASNGRNLLELDRKLIAATPTYDIYRGDGSGKIGWIEKKLIAMTDTFDVYMEGKGGFGVTGLFKPAPAYRITGDFLDRNFVMRNAQGQVVARVSEDWVIEFDAFNHYQVQVAPGMDAHLVLACLCAIDEEFDEEHKKKKEQEG